MIETCEHIFYSECIRQWIKDQSSCPIDRVHIEMTHLRHPQRSFKNILNALNIHCEFISLGCTAIVKLKDIKDHCQSCEFNPNFIKECVSGCGAKLLHEQNEHHDCIKYLSQKLSMSIFERDAIIEQQKKEIEELKTMHFTDASKMTILNRARAARNSPTIVMNTMNEKMTKNVIKIVAQSIEHINEWPKIADTITETMDNKYGTLWTCIMSSGVINASLSPINGTLLSLYLDDLSILIWKNKN